MAADPGIERAKENLPNDHHGEGETDGQLRLDQDSVALLREFLLLLDKWDRQRGDKRNKAA